MPVFLIVRLSLKVLPESAVFVAVTPQAVDELPDAPNFNTVIEYAGNVRALVLTPFNAVSFFVPAVNCSADVTLDGVNPLYAKLTGSDAEALWFTSITLSEPPGCFTAYAVTTESELVVATIDAPDVAKSPTALSP